MMNQFRTFLLLALLTGFILWIGQMLGGRQGLLLALFLAAAMNIGSYWFSDKIVLSMYRAQPVDAASAPELYQVVATLAKRAHLPVPRIYLINQDTPNAFATGRNPQNAVVAVTSGLIRIMEPEEIKGVLAHELAHVKNRDILIGSIAATMAGAVMFLASMARWSMFFGGSNDDDEGGLGIIGLLIMSILAPMAAMVIQMAISRAREYQADATGAAIAGNGDGLAGALEKLASYNHRNQMQAQPSTAHLFIVNPLSGAGLMNLFSTHPPIAQRVARLRGVPPHLVGEAAKPAPRNQAQEASRFWDRLNR